MKPPILDLSYCQTCGVYASSVDSDQLDFLKAHETHRIFLQIGVALQPPPLPFRRHSAEGPQGVK
jgi:hypothetical protein